MILLNFIYFDWIYESLSFPPSGTGRDIKFFDVNIEFVKTAKLLLRAELCQALLTLLMLTLKLQINVDNAQCEMIFFLLY